jgi:hypothetical protein
MKGSKLSVVVILLISMFLSSCYRMDFCSDGSRTIVTETLDIADFNGVELNEAATVYISQGEEQEVKVTGSENVVARLKEDVRSGVWEIDFGTACFRHYDLTVYITIPDLNLVSVNGAGTIIIEDFDDQDYLDLDISGFGEIELNEFEGLKEMGIDVSGTANIKSFAAIDDVDMMDIHVSGVIDLNAFPIHTNECRISISGTGNCEVYCEDDLDIHISGAAKVYYRGFPSINQRISGIGSVVDDN